MGPDLIKSCLFDKLRDAQKDEVDKMMADAPPGRPQVRQSGRGGGTIACALAQLQLSCWLQDATR